MNSELLEAIDFKLVRLEEQKEKIAKEYQSLLLVDKKLLKGKGVKQLEAMKSKLISIDEEVQSIENSVEEYRSLTEEVKDIKKLLKNVKSSSSKATMQKIYDEKKSKLEEVEESLKVEYGVYDVEELDEEEILESEVTLEEPSVETTEEETLEEEKIEEPEMETIEEVEEPTKDEDKDKKKNKKIIKVIAVLAALGILGSGIKVAADTVNAIKNGEKNNNPKPSTSDSQPMESKPVESLPIESAPVESITPEETYDVNVFDSLEDVDKLNARAEQIAETITPMLSDAEVKFDETELQDKIADTILVSNGELPLDENGVEYYDPSVLDYYTQFRTDTFGNIPSSPNNEKIYEVNYSDFAMDGSDLEEFTSRYDEVYNKVAAARNANDQEAFIAAAQSLGTLLYNDWVLQGMYNGYNPYNLDTNARLFALGASIERYPAYVRESQLGNRSKICVDVCIDYKTGEYKSIPVHDIFEAIVLGKSNDATLSMGTKDGYQVISEEFYNQTKEMLEYDYENNVLTLTK